MDLRQILYGLAMDLRRIYCGFWTYLPFQASFPEKMEVILHVGYDHYRVQDVRR